jgi:hypothetical protein
MKTVRPILAAGLAACFALFHAVPAHAEKGDLFLSLAPAIDAFESDGPSLGGGLGLQLGVNESTDFFLESILTTRVDSDEDRTLETHGLLGSLYTPYFGEIRPRFGGSAGVVHVSAPDVDEVYFNLGLHLQGLYDASDAFRLFAEVHPNLTFGSNGGFSTLFKVGLTFRLSN